MSRTFLLLTFATLILLASPEPKEHSHAINTGSLVGGVVGGVVGLAVLMFIITFLLIRRRRLTLSRSSQAETTPNPFYSPSEFSSSEKTEVSHASRKVRKSQIQEGIILGKGEQEISMVRELATEGSNENSRDLETRNSRLEDAVVEVLARLGLISGETPPSYASNYGV
jgi:hypothetical protein